MQDSTHILFFLVYTYDPAVVTLEFEKCNKHSGITNLCFRNPYQRSPMLLVLNMLNCSMSLMVEGIVTGDYLKNDLASIVPYPSP
jgi:hypothetical protein